MVYLSSSDIKTLENYNFISSEFDATRGNLKNETLLCIKNNSLTTVSSKDLTKWDFFKKIFGCGKLAGCELSLKSIAKYLEQKDLSNLEGPAYDKVHSIATRMVSHRKEGTSIPKLWKKLSTQDRTFSLQYATYLYGDYNGSPFVARSNPSVHLYITPKSTMRHLTAQVDLLKKHQVIKDIIYKTNAQSTGGLAGRCETGYFTWYQVKEDTMSATNENLKDVFFQRVTNIEFRGLAYQKLRDDLYRRQCQYQGRY